jgi:hypothetical protein
LELIACLLYFSFYSPFLSTYSPFSGQAECIPPHLERFQAQQGVEKQVGLRWLFCKKQNSWASHFQKEKTKLGWSCGKHI